jgi:hypothetical protein
VPVEIRYIKNKQNIFKQIREEANNQKTKSATDNI